MHRTHDMIILYLRDLAIPPVDVNFCCTSDAKMLPMQSAIFKCDISDKCITQAATSDASTESEKILSVYLFPQISAVHLALSASTQRFMMG